MSTLLNASITRLKLDTLPICFFAQDNKGQLVDCNKALLEHLGVESQSTLTSLSQKQLRAILESRALPAWLTAALCTPSLDDALCPFLELMSIRDEKNQVIGRCVFFMCLTKTQAHLSMLVKLKTLNAKQLDQNKLTTVQIEMNGGSAPVTRRELQVALLLLRGKSAKEMAIELGISSRTIETYIEKLKIKLNAYKKSTLVEKILSSDIADKLLTIDL